MTKPLIFGGVATCALLLTGLASAQDDPWFGFDKTLHFGASAGIAAGGYTLGALLFEERTSALALGAGLALTAGAGKEVVDAAGYGDPSARDLVWDVAGTVTGLGAAWLLDLLVRGDLKTSDEVPGSQTTLNTTSGVTFQF